jgi:hypothetical protein
MERWDGIRLTVVAVAPVVIVLISGWQFATLLLSSLTRFLVVFIKTTSIHFCVVVGDLLLHRREIVISLHSVVR